MVTLPSISWKRYNYLMPKKYSKPCRRLWAAVVLSASAWAMLGGNQAAVAEEAPSFFNSHETPSDNLEPFKRWNEALQRYTREVAEKDKGSCKATKLNKCHFQEWAMFLESIRGKDPMTQINEVNRVMNKANYVTDETNWGEKDYWATPGEFMARFGDCEDYAISKYMSLKVLGFKQEQIRVVAVKDLNLKVGHAILVVFLDKKVYVLDNQIKQVVEAQTIRHYQPVFSINDKNWWRHRV